MKLVIAALSVVMAGLLAGPATAAPWPDHAVRLIVPYPPGGNVDTAARVIANKLQETLKQPFVIENKAGAGGLIATVGASSAMTLAPASPAASALVQDVRWGCGPGWHPNPWGRCVPNRRVYYGRPVVRYYGHPRYYNHYGWHHGYYHHRWGY